MQPYEAIMIPKNEMGSEINHIEPIFYKKVEKRGKQQKSGDMTRRRNLLKKNTLDLERTTRRLKTQFFSSVTHSGEFIN